MNINVILSLLEFQTINYSVAYDYFYINVSLVILNNYSSINY